MLAVRLKCWQSEKNKHLQLHIPVCSMLAGQAKPTPLTAESLLMNKWFIRWQLTL